MFRNVTFVPPLTPCKTPEERLLEAARTGDLNLLKRLAKELDVGNDLKATVEAVKDAFGGTALHVSAAGGRTHVCKYLLDEVKLDINSPDLKGETPLHKAVRGDHYPTLIYLVENGANPNAATDSGYTPLHYAAEQGFKQVIQVLISKGAEIDAKGDCGTPLHRAALGGKKEAVLVLLANNANPNVVSPIHHILSPLVASVWAQSIECVKLLLEGGADPNLDSCVTPLEIAASKREAEIVKCLLNAGANPNVTNKFGVTPLEVAGILGHHESLLALYPVTSPIPTIEDWSFDGILKHVHSEEAQMQVKQKKIEHFLHSKSEGGNAIRRKDFIDAIYWYTEAIAVDPDDAALLANRSLCWAQLNRGDRALEDAQACIKLQPDWPTAHYRAGVAFSLLKDSGKAAETFRAGMKLDPENNKLNRAICEVIGNADVDFPDPKPSSPPMSR